MADNTQGPLSAAELREMLDQGRGAEAIARLERDLEQAERRAGARSFTAAMVHEALSMAQIARGETSAAIAHLEQALACEPRGDAEKKALISMHNELAMALERGGQFERAEAALEAALERRRAMFGPEHPAYGFGLAWLAEFLARRGDPRALDLALQAFQNLQRNGHPRLAEMLVLMARLQARAGLDHPFATMDLDVPIWDRIGEIMPRGAEDFSPRVVVEAARSYLRLSPADLPHEAQGRRDVAVFLYSQARNLDQGDERDGAIAAAIEAMMRAALPDGLVEKVEIADNEPQIYLTRDVSEEEQQQVSRVWEQAMLRLRAG